MKVVLIEVTAAPYRRNPLSQMARVLEPLAIEYIGAYLEQFGHYVTLIHQLEEDNEAVAARVREVAPDMVGISCMTYSFPDGQDIARRIKSQCHRTTTVLGGYHTIGLTECPDGFDFVVKGEGELPCRDILDFIGNRSRQSLADLRGVMAYRDPATGKSVLSKFNAPVEILPQLPWPRRLKRELYFSLSMGENLPATRLACIMIGRGCPFRCDFCCTPQIFQGRRGIRSMDDVVDEIQALQQGDGVNTLNIRDETFAPEKVVLAFCDKLRERKVHIHWRAFATVGTLKQETITRMAAAGCHMLFFGVEASDAETLTLRRKSFAKHIERVSSDIHFAQSCGIFVRAGFIVGHETDSPATFERHLEFLKEVHPDELYVSFLTPFPGTPLFTRAEKEGRITDRDWNKYDCEHPILRVPGLSTQQLIDFRQKLYMEYYASREWRDHLQARIKRRPWEATTIENYVRFIESKMATPGSFAVSNGS